jgi:hypothetical protein
MLRGSPSNIHCTIGKDLEGKGGFFTSKEIELLIVDELDDPKIIGLD